jgi:hypothetical protein
LDVVSLECIIFIEYKNESVTRNILNGLGIKYFHCITQPSFEHEKNSWLFVLLRAMPRTQSVWPTYLQTYSEFVFELFKCHCFIVLSALPVRTTC